MVWKGKNLISKEVWKDKNFFSKGVWKGKNFVHHGALIWQKYYYRRSVKGSHSCSLSLRSLPKTATRDPFFRYLPAYYSVEGNGGKWRSIGWSSIIRPLLLHEKWTIVVAVRLGKALYPAAPFPIRTFPRRQTPVFGSSFSWSRKCDVVVALYRRPPPPPPVRTCAIDFSLSEYSLSILKMLPLSFRCFPLLIFFCREGQSINFVCWKQDCSAENAICKSPRSLS